MHLTGHLVNANTQEPLPYVNIGIKIKNKGTTSPANGSFSILIPQELIADTLTSSLVGFHSLDLPIQSLLSKKELLIRLYKKTTQLDQVNIRAEKLVEKKYGIKNAICFYILPMACLKAMTSLRLDNSSSWSIGLLTLPQ